MNPIFYIDFYKQGHVIQYAKGTQQVWSNWTARSSRTGRQSVVFFGLQYFLKKYLLEEFHYNFFSRPLYAVLSEYREIIKATLGVTDPKTDHIEYLHNLGYLPLDFYALPEGSSVPIKVPSVVVTNTDDNCYWLPNYIESVMSAILWKPSTSATTAQEYRDLFIRHAKRSGETDLSFVNWQGHDFSFRGMSGLEDAILSGMGHLTSFNGTDTLPAILTARQYYGADLTIGGSVPATEHSVMCSGGQDGEFDTFKRLITETYPTGIVSVVSDTWDLWKVLTDYVPRLKDTILARDGKLVIRPDSGDPVKIICGDDIRLGSPAFHGTLRLLRNALGTTPGPGLPYINKAGAIYGDSITLERADQILTRTIDELKLSPYNMVFGIGSYCVEINTPILCSDLVWRKAGEIAAGQEIIAFDENPKFGKARNAARNYKLAKIQSNRTVLKYCSRITTDIGDPITASNDHPWLVWSEHRSPEDTFFREAPKGVARRKFPRTAGLEWKCTNELRAGDQIAFLCKPWEQDTARSTGWLEGIFDGEGCLSRSNGTSIPSWKVNISQNQGYVMSRIKKELIARNFGFYENRRKNGQVTLTGGWLELLRFLGTVAPRRLLQKLVKTTVKLPALKRDYTFKLATVSSIKPVGIEKVASIQTSSGTFITVGYLSHNTYEYVTRDTYGHAMKATAVRNNNEIIPIFKKPVTDDGLKTSLKGIPCVYQKEWSTSYYVIDGCKPESLDNCAFRKVFSNGRLLIDDTFDTIRKRARHA